MKNSIIAILIGAVLVLVYQSLSWMMLPIHANSHKYTTMEDSLLQSMNGLESGVYFLPGEPPGASMEEIQAKREGAIGKPWALLYYHETMEMNMFKSIGLAFLINVILVWLIVWIIKTGNITEKQAIFKLNFVVALIIVFSALIMQWNWFSTPMHNLVGDVIDQLAATLPSTNQHGGYYHNGKASRSRRNSRLRPSTSGCAAPKAVTTTASRR